MSGVSRERAPKRASICPRPRAIPGPRLSAACAVCEFGKRRLGAALEDDGALLPGDVASGREGRPRLVLVVAAERQQAFPAQAIDLRQIEAAPRFTDPAA